jgi:hypothetical protein
VSVLPSSYVSGEERSMRDCKSKKRSNDFVVGVSVYSVKKFSGNKSSFYEIESVGINGLADDEGITLQEPVTYRVRLSPVKLSLCNMKLYERM